MRKVSMISLMILLLFLFNSIDAQSITVPRLSPKASVSQNFGLTDVTVTFGRPGVKDRIIWGELVPYNSVWRAGANEATTVYFSDNVKIDGNEIPSGTYSLFLIPQREEEWTIIFNKVADQWGAYQYDEKEDVLRIKASPEKSNFQEWLNFTFEELSENSVKLVMYWEKIKLSFKIEADVISKVITNGRAAFNEGKEWYELYQYAQFCLTHKTNIDEAVQWIDKSILLNENYMNLVLKAKLLAFNNNFKDAATYGEKALSKAETMKNAPADIDETTRLITKWKNSK